MKRWISLLLVFAMTFSLCGGINLTAYADNGNIELAGESTEHIHDHVHDEDAESTEGGVIAAAPAEGEDEPAEDAGVIALAEEEGSGSIAMAPEEIGDEDENGETVRAASEEVVYVLVDSWTVGNDYLIVGSGSTGSSNALTHSSGSVGVDAVTIKAATEDTGAVYIEAADVDAASIWSPTTSGNYTKLKNGNYFLQITTSSYTLSAATSETYSDNTWTFSNKVLKAVYTGSQGTSNTRYVAYSSNKFSGSQNSSSTIYLYEKLVLNTEVVYDFSADNVQVMANEDGTVDSRTIKYKLTADGTKIDPTEIVFSVKEGTDTNSIISGISDSGAITFTGNTGTATVTVSFTYTPPSKSVEVGDDGTVTGSVDITVTVKEHADHNWSENPVWLWEEDYSGATAVFACMDDGCEEEYISTATIVAETNTPTCITPKQTTYTATAVGPDQVTTFTDVKTVGGTGTVVVYKLVSALQNGGEYLIVSTNTAGTGNVLKNNSGTVAADSYTIHEADADVNAPYILASDVSANNVITATTNSSGFTLTTILNNQTYYFEAYGSTSAIHLATTQAYSARYWEYSSNHLGFKGGNGDHYIYYSSGFLSAKDSTKVIYVYEKTTVAHGEYGDHNWVFQDFTWNEGYASAYATYKCSICGETNTVGAAVTSEHRTVTCERPDRTQYIATVAAGDSLDKAEHVDDDTAYVPTQIAETTEATKTVYVLTNTITVGSNYLLVSAGSAAEGAHALKNNSGSLGDSSVNILSGNVNGVANTYIETVDAEAVWTAQSNSSTTYPYQFESVYNGTTYYVRHSSGQLAVSSDNSDTSKLYYALGTNQLYYKGGQNTYYLTYSSGWTLNSGSGNVYLYEEVPNAMITTTVYHDAEALGHLFPLTYTEAVAATCTTAGNVEYWTCERDGCGQHFADEEGTTKLTNKQIVVPALGHDWGEPTWTWAADYSSATANFVCARDPEHTASETDAAPVSVENDDGGFTFTATVTLDGEEYTDSKTVAGEHTHTLVAYPAVAATCTAEGNIAYWMCAICGKYFSDAAGENEITLADTVLPLAVHTLTKTEAVAATCEEAGNSEYWTCSVCGRYFSDAEGTAEIQANSWVIPMKGHNWGQPTWTWAADYTSATVTFICQNDSTHKETATASGDTISVTTTDPTCSAEGKTSYVASVTGPDNGTYLNTQEVSIAKLPHTPAEAVQENAIAATCEAGGSYDEVVYCSVCGEEISRTARTTPALGHDWGEPVWNWADDYSSATATFTCGNNSAHVETINAEITDVTTAPTCTTTGSTVYTATAAFAEEEYNDSKTVSINALGHTPGDPVREHEVAATCETEGSYEEVVKCSVCGAVLSRTTKTTDPLGHNYKLTGWTWSADNKNATVTFTCENDSSHVEVLDAEVTSVTTNPTCTVAGNTVYTATATFENTEYTDSKTVTLDPLGHTPGDPVRENEAAATCEAAGSYDEVVCCSVCGEELSRTAKTTEALGHAWGDWTVTNEATCTEEGVETRTCSRCEKTETRPIAALGHTLVKTEAVAATCETAGNSEYYTCSVCGKYFSDAEGETEIGKDSWVIPATGHTLVKTEAVAAACETAGNSEYYTCSVCGKYFSDAEGKTEIEKDSWVLATLGHTLVKTEAVDAACETAGNSEYWTCSVCGKYFSDAEGKTEIEKDSWVIAATGHTVATDAAVTATCTETGLTEGSHCSICGKVLVAQEVVPALGHKYSEPTYVWADDNSTVTATRVCANDETHAETETVAATYVITTPATETTAGVGTWTSAEFENEAFEVQTKEVPIPPYGYKISYAWADDYSEVTATAVPYDAAAATVTETVATTAEITTPATCTEKGKTTYTATFKNDLFSEQTETVENIDALGHTLVKTEAVAAACETAGNSEYWTCSVCGKYFSDAEGKTEIEKDSWVIAALGHTVVKTEAVAAACETAGNSEYWTCSVCGKYFSDAEGKTEIEKDSWVIDALGHTLVKTEAVAAACETAGNSEYYTCSVCGKYFSDAEGRTEVEKDSWVLAALGHTLVKTEAVDAACETAGNSEYWTCSVCGKYFSDAEGKTEIEKNSWVIDALGHTVVTDAAVAATCTETGLTEGSHCSICGKVLVAQEVVPALGHKYGEPTYVWADDNSTVTATRVCANDETHAETETVAATYAITTPATETTAGVGTWTSAEFENEAFEVQTKEVPIPPYGYKISYAWADDYSEVTATAVPYDAAAATVTETVDTTPEVTRQATCEEKGETTYTATFENKLFTVQTRTADDIPALGHTLVKTEAVAATCETAGNSEYWTCSVCGKYFSDAEGKTEIEKDSWVIPATGHTLVKTEAVAAACETAGNSEYWTCSVCGKYFSDAEGRTEIEKDSWVIAALGHTAVTDAAVAATCTETGLTEGSHCSVCGKELVAQEVVPALGHKYGEPTYVWADDNSTVTATAVCANDESHKVTETVETFYKVTKEPTEDETGTGVYAAIFTDSLFSAQTKEVEIPMLEPTTLTLALTNTANGVDVSWNRLGGADKYKLERKTADGEWIVLSASLTERDFLDGNVYQEDGDVLMGETYTYRVTGYVDGAWSDYSNEASILFNPFTDVEEGNATFRYISWAYNNQIIKGSGDGSTFDPADGCTRMNFVMMLWKMAGQPDPKGTKNPFTDVTGTKSTKAVLWAYYEGIIVGTSATTFTPDAEVTRAQIVMMLWKMAGQPKATIDNPFTDVTGAKLLKAVLWAYENKITTGTSKTTFSPNNTCTRWQLVTFLYKYDRIYHVVQ